MSLIHDRFYDEFFKFEFLTVRENNIILVITICNVTITIPVYNLINIKQNSNNSVCLISENSQAIENQSTESNTALTWIVPWNTYADNIADRFHLQLSPIHGIKRFPIYFHGRIFLSTHDDIRFQSKHPVVFARNFEPQIYAPTNVVRLVV